jgi:hypothetical protein
MATPMFNFRLPPDQAERLREVAKLYGTNTSQFLREMIGAFTGGHASGPAYFLEKFGSAIGQAKEKQMQFELFAQQQAQKAAIVAQAAAKAPKRGKGAKRAKRAT